MTTKPHKQTKAHAQTLHSNYKHNVKGQSEVKRRCVEGWSGEQHQPQITEDMNTNTLSRERRNVDQVISVIGMPVPPTLGIIPSWHNTTSASLLIPLGVGTIVKHSKFYFVFKQ